MAMRPRRRVAAAALVLIVLALHALVTRQVALRMADFARALEMPPRITVAYVRELELAPPPVAPKVVAPARKRASPAAPVGPAASAPVAAEAEPPQQPPAPALAEAPPAASAPGPAQASASPDAAASAASGEVFDWPISTRLTYELSGNYRGEVRGDAQVEWVRVGTRYQVHVDLSVGARAAPLISRRMSSEGELVGDRLLPSRYDEDTRVLFGQPRRVTILLGADEIVLANGDRVPREPGVQDAASQFIQLAAMFTTRPELLRAGGTIEMVIVLRNRVGRWIYDILGEEEIATPFGRLATHHLQPRGIVNRGNELTAEIWFAPQLRYLPVRIRIRQDADTFVDLVIARRPEIAAQ
jgi:hypothetical protein